MKDQRSWIETESWRKDKKFFSFLYSRFLACLRRLLIMHEVSFLCEIANSFILLYFPFHLKKTKENKKIWKEKCQKNFLSHLKIEFRSNLIAETLNLLTFERNTLHCNILKRHFTVLENVIYSLMTVRYMFVLIL
jgi:hypothetical protein